MKKLFLSFLEILSLLLRPLPRGAVRALGMLIGVLWFDILRIRRRVVKENLDIAFPDMPDEEKKKIARKSVYRLGANFMEVFTIPGMSEKWLEKNIVYVGYENIEKAKALNKGVYLLGMHLGPGDVVGTSLAMKGNLFYIITKTFKNKIFNDMWFRFRSRRGVKFIGAHGENTAFEILRAIKNKGLVVFVLDQFMGRPYAVENTFFGRKTGTAYGLALFYLKTRSPVVPIYGYEGEDGKLRVVCEPPLSLESFVGSDQDKSVYDLTQHFCDVIEAAIRKHPNDWMWVHRRWKEYE